MEKTKSKLSVQVKSPSLRNLGGRIALAELAPTTTLRAVMSMVDAEAASLGARGNLTLRSGTRARLFSPDDALSRILDEFGDLGEGVTVDAEMSTSFEGGSGPAARTGEQRLDSRDSARPPAQHELTLTEEARECLRAYARAVDERSRGDEFSLLLLGPPGSDVVTHVHLMSGQETWRAHVKVPEEAVRESLQLARAEFPDLQVLGVAHRHPGDEPSSVFHSHTDESEIEGRVLPLLAVDRLERKVWRRTLEVRQEESGARQLWLDAEGRVSIELSSCGEDERARFELCVQQKQARVYSVVFSERVSHLYVCSLNFFFPPNLDEHGARRPAWVTERAEPVLAIRPAQELGVVAARMPSERALQEEVREKLRRPMLSALALVSPLRSWMSPGAAPAPAVEDALKQAGALLRCVHQQRQGHSAIAALALLGLELLRRLEQLAGNSGVGAEAIDEHH